MKSPVFLLFFYLALLSSCGEKEKSNVEEDKTTINSEVTISHRNQDSTSNETNSKFLHTEYNYTDANGNEFIIQNSLPKGGGNIVGEWGYTDSKGKEYAYVIFWTRVVNKSSNPLKIDIEFPRDSLAIFRTPDSYLKLFLPPDRPSERKLPSYNYGIKGLKSFLDFNFNQRSKLQTTIKPKDEHLFYVVALSYNAEGLVRGGFVLNDENLIYRISIEPHGSAKIPSGRFYF